MSKQTPHPPFCWRKIVLPTHLIVILASIGYTLSRPAIAFITQQGPGGGIVAVSLLTTGFLLARGIASPLAGYLGDRSPRARIILMRTPLLATALVLTLMYLLPYPLALLLLMTLWGLLSGLLWPTLQYAVSHVGGTRSLGVYFALGGVGMSLGYLLYGALEMDDPTAIMASALFLGASGALAMITYHGGESCIANNPKAANAGQQSRAGSGGIRFSSAMDSLAAWVLVAALVMGATRGLLGEFLYVYLAEVHGLSKTMLGGVLGASQLASVGASIAAGYLAERWGLARVLAGVLAGNGMALVVLASNLGLAVVSASLILVNFAISASLPLTRTVAVSGDPRLAGTVIGLSNTIGNLGGALLPIAAAIAYEAFSSHGTVFGVLEPRGLVFAVLGFLSLALAFSSRRLPRRG